MPMNAYVASCGWLRIHEVYLQAFGFGVKPACSQKKIAVPESPAIIRAFESNVEAAA